MSRLRVVVLAGSDASDKYVAAQLMRRTPVVGVFVERLHKKVSTSRRIMKALKYTVRPGEFIRRMREVIRTRRPPPYGEIARQVRSECFGEVGLQIPSSGNPRVICTEGGLSVNDPAYVDEVRKLEPDVIAVYGSSILKEEILSIPSQGTLNLHGGLSQKYRGVHSAIWALYNEEPEYVGATIHHVDLGVDTGDIVCQDRPVLGAEDNPATLDAKVVLMGIDMMVASLQGMMEGRLERYPLEEAGTLYRRKDLTRTVIRSAYEKSGRVIGEYLKNKASRDRDVLAMMKGHRG